MNEQEQGGAQQTAQTESAQTQQGSESVPESEQVGLPPEVAKSYEGKSPDELAKMHYELSKKLGEQGAVIGSLKDLVDELRAGRETKREDPFKPQVDYSQQTTRQEPAEEEYNDEDYLTIGTAKKLIGDIFGKRDEVSQQQVIQQNLQRAGMAHVQGKASMKDNPKLFEGIEDKVEKAIVEYYKPFAMSGADVSPYLSDPNVWRKAAISIRFDQNEFDRIVPEKTQPIRPTSMEEPASTKPYVGTGTPVELNFQDRDMQEFLEAVENETGKRVSTKAQDVEETVGRGNEVWRGDNVLTTDK